MLYKVAVCCSMLQCVAVCCSVLQCVAVCCGALQCVANLMCTPHANIHCTTHTLSHTHTHTHTHRVLNLFQTTAIHIGGDKSGGVWQSGSPRCMAAILKCRMTWSCFANGIPSSPCSSHPRGVNCNTKHLTALWSLCESLYYTLQHTATHCNTLQHATTHCNTLNRNMKYLTASCLGPTIENSKLQQQKHGCTLYSPFRGRWDSKCWITR